MNTHLQVFMLRALRRNGGPLTEAELVAMGTGAFSGVEDGDVRDNLAGLEDDGLIISSRIPVLKTRQYGLTAAGTSAAAALR